MNLCHLMPLVGRWSGSATVLSPGSEPIVLRHTEEVRVRNAATIITIEGASYKEDSNDASEPVFTAFTVITAADDGLRFHAYSQGGFLNTDCDTGPGRLSWLSPGPPSARYTSQFDEQHWRNIGEQTATGLHVFRMHLQRDSSAG